MAHWNPFNFPQALQIQTNICTLHDAEKLLGTINWVRSLLGISNAELSPLFGLLNGDSDLLSSRQLTLQAQQALQCITDALVNRQAFLFNNSASSKTAPHIDLSMGLQGTTPFAYH